MPGPQIDTSRVGGGSTSRAAAAVLLMVVLVALAGWLGRAAQPEPPDSGALPDRPRPTAAASDRASPSATPSPSLSPSATPAPSPSPTPFVTPTMRPGSAEELAVVVKLGSHTLFSFLREQNDGRLRGAVRYPYPRPMEAGTLELVQLWNYAGASGSIELGRFEVSLDQLLPETRRSGTLIDQRVAAGPALGAAPAKLRHGYALHVRAEGRDGFALIRVTLLPEATR